MSQQACSASANFCTIVFFTILHSPIESDPSPHPFASLPPETAMKLASLLNNFLDVSSERVSFTPWSGIRAHHRCVGMNKANDRWMKANPTLTHNSPTWQSIQRDRDGIMTLVNAGNARNLVEFQDSFLRASESGRPQFLPWTQCGLARTGKCFKAQRGDTKLKGCTKMSPVPAPARPTSADIGLVLALTARA